MTEFTGGPGFAAFVATFSLVLVTIVLMRSLNKQLRKVRTARPEGGAVMESKRASGTEDDDRDGGKVAGESRDS
ncbi:hypothetical protein [Demequina aurantiaca]|uniref:hypothetical protein n=1 Tax=Demequina aurantiaca TaxID=676200 RepID=UPI00128E541E|nr:hypothetical protein [Demequina aurantiaca]